MTTALKTLDVADVPDVLKEIEEAFFDIPFENSAYQNKAFVVAAQQTPGRAYRAIGLRMFSKIQAVKEHLYNQELNRINLEEKREKLAGFWLGKYERRRLELEIAKMEDGAGYAAKLFNDALRDLDCMYAEFKKLPTYTREQFEAEEINHFTLRLQRQVSAGGAHESIANMTEDLPQWEQRIQKAVAGIGRSREAEPLKIAGKPPGRTLKIPTF